jgi:Zn finger protein HypA/HybF involved in hydrogenase expression
VIELLHNTENALKIIEELLKEPCQCNKTSLVMETKDFSVYCKKCQLVMKTKDMAVTNLQYYIDNMIMKK